MYFNRYINCAEGANGHLVYKNSRSKWNGQINWTSISHTCSWGVWGDLTPKGIFWSNPPVDHFGGFYFLQFLVKISNFFVNLLIFFLSEYRRWSASSYFVSIAFPHYHSDYALHTITDHRHQKFRLRAVRSAASASDRTEFEVFSW